MNTTPSSTISRRGFLSACIAAGLLPHAGFGQAAKPKRILLRSAWQTVNIGDIAHTPGMLHLLEEMLPDAEIALWPSDVGNGVDEILKARFPKLKIMKRGEVREAFGDFDFLLHGSGPSLVGAKEVEMWVKETGKPWGALGITWNSPQQVPLLNTAKFVFFRDSVSLAAAKNAGVTGPVMDFGPDAAFSTDLRDDEKAKAFLAASGLEEGRFLCCLSRFRYTPYWLMPEKKREFDEKRHARNQEMKEHDHAALRAAIIAVVRETPMKVLLCPEDKSQMAIGKEMFLDKLPDDVKAKVVWRENYWLTGEALSTYVRSAGLFGSEMHSPIMCIGNGVPAIVCRFKEQTSKGIMWRDIGLGDWLFDLDVEEEVAKIVPTVLAMAKDPAAAKAKAAKAREVVRARQRAAIDVLQAALKA